MLLLLDGTNLVYRAFYASPQLYGGLLASWIAALNAAHRPDETFVALDAGRSFRHDLSPDYKAGRSPKPEELRAYLAAMQSIYAAHDGFEADDLIASRLARHDGPAVIVSGDLDMCALVTARVRLVRPPKWKDVLGPDEVFDLMGVWPDQVTAYKSIRGDVSDNVPGVRGLGAVKTRRLLATHGTFEGVLAALSPQQQAEARTAWSLVALRTDAPV